MLTGRFSATEMSRGNVTHAFPAWQIAELLSVLAERVGFFEAVSQNPNECWHFQRNAPDVNDLASSNFRQGSRPLASVC